MPVALLLMAVAVASCGVDPQSSECDRECLSGMVDTYLEALRANAPGRLPLADGVRFTEDTVQLELGEGLWENASGLRAFRQDILDVREAVAASMVVAEESGMPVLLMLRLKVEDGKIAEIESVVTRSREEGILLNISGFETPSPEMAIVPTPSQRASRSEAIRIADFYPAGLIVGSFVEVDAPFSPDAYRFENGGRMAGPGCTRPGCENIKTQNIIEHPDLTSEVKAVDEELGIVLLRMNFGDTGSYGDGNALIVWEAFKVYDHQIHAVEAFMEIMPADAGSGWN